jgi:hypothetical protein
MADPPKRPALKANAYTCRAETNFGGEILPLRSAGILALILDRELELQVLAPDRSGSSSPGGKTLPFLWSMIYDATARNAVSAEMQSPEADQSPPLRTLSSLNS